MSLLICGCSITAYTTSMTLVGFPHALSQSMHSSTLPTASKKWAWFGAIGRFRWNGTVVPCSPQFGVAVSHMHQLIATLLRMHNWHKSRLFTAAQKSWHCEHLGVQLLGSAAHFVRTSHLPIPPQILTDVEIHHVYCSHHITQIDLPQIRSPLSQRHWPPVLMSRLGQSDHTSILPLWKNGESFVGLIPMRVTLCGHHHAAQSGMTHEMRLMFGCVICIIYPSCQPLRTNLQYEMYVDKFARRRGKEPEYTLKTFYGQLQHLYVIRFNTACPRLQLNAPTTVILAAIWTCILEDLHSILVDTLDIHDYSKDGSLHVVDVTSIQCLVARVKDETYWSILDRSGTLARAISADSDDDADM